MTGLNQRRNLQAFDKDQYLVAENATGVAHIKLDNPRMHWTIPYVTGHKYYVRWSYGIDFESVGLGIVPWLWEDGDRLEMVTPHIETRSAIEFTANVGGL